MKNWEPKTRQRSFEFVIKHLHAMRCASLVLIMFGVFLAACGGSADLGPPTGWEGQGTERWWRTGSDTTGTFRNLATLETMGVRVFEDVDLGPSVQNRMLEFYRTNPEIVDSVFVEYGLPVVERGDATISDRTDLRERLVTDAYRAMVRYYRDARPDPNVQIEKVYPDSLRERGIGGPVEMQVRINAEGEPVAIEKLVGVDPTLDALAMQAVANMRWVHAGHAGVAVPSWTRMTITY